MVGMIEPVVNDTPTLLGGVNWGQVVAERNGFHPILYRFQEFPGWAWEPLWTHWADQANDQLTGVLLYGLGDGETPGTGYLRMADGQTLTFHSLLAAWGHVQGIFDHHERLKRARQ